MVDPEVRQDLVKPRCGPAQGAVPGAVASDDGTCLRERDVRVWRDRPVVDARRGEAVPGRQRQGEAAAHAEPDDADPARAVGLTLQPGARRLDIVERATSAGADVADRRPQAAEAAAPGEEVGGRGEVARTGEPVGLPPEVLAHPARVVDDHDAGPRPVAGRPRHVLRHGGRGCRDRHVGHGGFPSLHGRRRWWPAAPRRRPFSRTGRHSPGLSRGDFVPRRSFQGGLTVLPLICQHVLTREGGT